MLVVARGVNRLCAPPQRFVDDLEPIACDGGVHRRVNLERRSPNGATGRSKLAASYSTFIHASTIARRRGPGTSSIRIARALVHPTRKSHVDGSLTGAVS